MSGVTRAVGNLFGFLFTIGEDSDSDSDSDGEHRRYSSIDIAPHERTIGNARSAVVEPVLEGNTNYNDAEFTQRPRSESEARDHISSIRREKGIDQPDGPSNDLIHALNILANDLYQKPTHFLLELVQNTDDNSYGPTVIPTMNITWSPGMLRIDSNELGFSRKNVEAICRIGQSSKKGSARTIKYIGQKGIGFKSVFKAANVVHIHSGHYSFKFDKSAPLGMIVPIWSAFPQDRFSGMTSILLELAPEYNSYHLIEELKIMDSSTLLFLRQLRKIHIQIKNSDWSWTDALWSRSPWEARLSRHREVREGPLRKVTVSHGEKISTYWIASQRLNDLPYDSRREGIEQSEILLGFPVNEMSNRVEPQLLYAFLPVRNYGFKFMIQADFLLVANREDIDDCSWNDALITAIPSTFLTAVQEFNESENRYSWLKYLSDETHHPAPFDHVVERIIDLLSNQEILESQHGVFMRPGELTRIPQKFRGHDGTLLLPEGSEANNVLSDRYPSCFEDELERLCVKTMSSSEFLSQLQVFISRDPSAFQGMPHEWHSTLARLLSTLFVENEVNPNIIKRLSVIPLSDGRWVTGDDDPIYFPIESSLSKPVGLGIMEVHSAAMKSPDRLKLLQLLSVREANKYGLAEDVLTTHQNSQFKADSVSLSDLIDHAFVLYSTQIRCWGKPFWFICEDGIAYQSTTSTIYIDVDESDDLWASSATKMFSVHRSRFRFLHQDYFKAFRDAKSRRWLVDNFFIQKIPCLSQYSQLSFQHILHDDFSFLMSTLPSADVLCLMRDNWSSYSNNWNEGLCPTSLVSEVSKLEVDCHGQHKVKLSDTFLPRDEVLMRCKFSADKLCSISSDDGFNILGCDICQLVNKNCNNAEGKEKIEGNLLLKLPNPNDPKWSFLEKFGVVMKVGHETLLARLTQLRELSLTDPSVTKSHACSIYDQLQTWVRSGDISMSEIQSIKDAFTEQELIFMPDATLENARGLWLSKNSCVWDGPQCLIRMKKISSFYPNHEYLFCDALAIPLADIHTLAAEAQQLKVSDDLGRIYRLLSAISKSIATEESRQNKNIPPFQEYEMFPIRTANSLYAFDNLKAASRQGEWYIADSEPLRLSFDGLIDLLATDGAIMDKGDPLIERLGLSSRLLSSHVKENVDIVGKGMYMQQFTKTLQTKARYLGLLIPDDFPNRQAILEQLEGLRVYEALIINLKRCVVFQGETVEGFVESTDVGVMHEGQALKIYMLRKDLAENNYPAELEERLISFCGIESSKHSIVSYLLRESNLERIKAFLKKRGITAEIQDLPDTDMQDFIVKTTSNLITSLPDTNPNDREPSTTHNPIPSGFDSMDRGSFTFNTPHLSYDEKASQFYAELYVSATLGKIMGQDYEPAIHWTSPLRTRAGYKPFSRLSSGTLNSQFTIRDDKNILSTALSKVQAPQAINGTTSSTYYIEVCVSGTGLESSFRFQSEIMKKRELHDVFILARVYDIYKQPGISFFTDPWKLHLDGLADLSFYSVYGSNLKKEAAIWTQNSPNSDLILGSRNLYAYKPLGFQQIRLLELLPGTDKDELRGKIHHSSVTAPDRPAYCALSYVWGLVGIGIIGCSLETDDGIIEITPSLDVALRRLRATDRAKWLWIDAICINQKDTLEKKLQIAIMHHIFRLANDTIIWLGTEEDDSDFVIKLLRGICSDSDGSPSTGNDSPDGDTEEAIVLDPSKLTTDDLHNINKLLARSWFARVWVIQELVWASKATIVCGLSSISWDAFYMALRICEKRINKSYVDKDGDGFFVFPNGGPAHALGYMRDRLETNRRKLPLLSLLNKFSYSRATLERDKIFALLNLASEQNDLLYADYESTLEDVVHRFARFFVDQGHAFDLLYGSGTSKAYSFSSWIPNWTSNDRPTLQTISTWRAGKNGGFHAGGPADPSAKYKPRISTVNFTLEIQGWSVDHVEEISSSDALRPTYYGSEIPIKIMKDIQSAIRGLVFGYQYPTGEAADDLVLKIPIGDASGPHRNAQMIAALAHRDFLLQDADNDEDVTDLLDTTMSEWDADLKSVVSSVHLDADSSVYLSLPPRKRMLYARYWETVLEFAKRFPSASFVTTGRRYVGIVPKGAKQGDQICIFPGAEVPFLLRKNTSSGLYQLIGECYIHGIMFGEARSLNGVVEQKFELE